MATLWQPCGNPMTAILCLQPGGDPMATLWQPYDVASNIWQAVPSGGDVGQPRVGVAFAVVGVRHEQAAVGQGLTSTFVPVSAQLRHP
jgi:hypothetical protein